MILQRASGGSCSVAGRAGDGGGRDLLWIRNGCDGVSLVVIEVQRS